MLLLAPRGGRSTPSPLNMDGFLTASVSTGGLNWCFVTLVIKAMMILPCLLGTLALGGLSHLMKLDKLEAVMLWGSPKYTEKPTVSTSCDRPKWLWVISAHVIDTWVNKPLDDPSPSHWIFPVKVLDILKQKSCPSQALSKLWIYEQNIVLCDYIWGVFQLSIAV